MAEVGAEAGAGAGAEALEDTIPDPVLVLDHALGPDPLRASAHAHALVLYLDHRGDDFGLFPTIYSSEVWLL